MKRVTIKRPDGSTSQFLCNDDFVEVIRQSAGAGYEVIIEDVSSTQSETTSESEPEPDEPPKNRRRRYG